MKDNDAIVRMDKFIEEAGLPPYFEPEPTVDVGRRGHQVLMSKVTHARWQSELLVKGPDGRLTFPDPEWHFNVHFEAQVVVGKPRVGLFLHFETNPYFSRAKLQMLTDPSQLAKYYAARERFLDEFALHCHVPGFELSRLPVQVGRTEFDCEDKDVVAVQDWLRSTIEEVGDAVNWTLYHLNERRRLSA